MKKTKILPNMRSFFKKITNEAEVVGYIDKIASDGVHGWAIHKAGLNLKLECEIDGNLCQGQTKWFERIDVATKYELENSDCGFRIVFAGQTASMLHNAVALNKPIRVFANNTLLENIAQKQNPNAKALMPESGSIREDNAGLSAEIEAWGHFTLQGWIEVPAESAEVPAAKLFCNREFLNSVFLRQEQRSSSIDKIRYRFEAELPGYIWEQNSEEILCQLDISLGAETINLIPPELNRLKVLNWIADILQMQSGEEKQYRLLLAVEHIRYGNFLTELEAEDVEIITNFAKQMQLDDFFLTPDSNLEIAEAEEISESVAMLLLWKALRTLNSRLREHEGTVFEEIRTVIDELRLQGEAREGFLRSVTPLLCAKGEFLRLRELSDFKHLQNLEKSDELWQMSIALPAIMVDKDIPRVTSLLYKMAKNLDSGWLSTECIYFSVKALQQMEADVEIKIEMGQTFRYALIELITAFKGDWFSRLHDRYLIDSILLLLIDFDRYTDYHRTDILNATLQHYGLNPTFWQRAAAQQLPLLTTELAYAQQQFQQLHQALINKNHSVVTWLEELSRPLMYFQAKNNPEAVFFVREILANTLPELNESLSSKGQDLIAKLLADDVKESLRISAFPLTDSNQLIQHFPETNPAVIRETLRNLSEPEKSITWHLQMQASQALKELFLCIDEDADLEQVEKAFAKLGPTVIKIADYQGGFLSFDLLASAYILIAQYGQQGSALLTHILTHMQWMLQKAVEETKADWYLPAPVQSGLIRLQGELIQTDSLLRGFVAECHKLIKQKFGERMEFVFEKTSELKLELSTAGWPQDTLVVIYSCRKYLETRVQAIRDTWIQELKARKIPYVILVGDGDDSLQDDVLALDVSDRYESLPQKTLKLFDWVYNHTNAQYVLKIDDDCYLDVAQFFDSLSYRKHFYYGRVIHREVGGMDRTWHQTKSQAENGQKRIDKSPEPSVYTDGGGGYTLSRLAMFELLAAEKTVRGERLISCSFMEDKLVGDLLASAFIAPSNEDYESYQRRRTFPEAMPVSIRENIFFPCQATPTKVAHLDSQFDLQPTYDKRHSKELWPKKLWPTCSNVKIKTGNSNQLELLTDPKQMNALLEYETCVVTVVRNEILMLPHFLAHYRKLGINCFMMVDNCSDDGTREYLFKQPDVILYSADTEYKHSHFGVVWQQTILGNHCLGKWVILADADELFVFEQDNDRSLDDLIEAIEAEGCNAALTYMIDMYPFTDLNEADFSKDEPFKVAAWFDKNPLTEWKLGSGMYSNSSTYLSALRHRLSSDTPPNSFTSQKYALIRYYPWIRYSEGLHDAANIQVSKQKTWFAHFKYHAGFKAKVMAEIQRGQHFGDAAEYRKYAIMLHEGTGKFGNDKVSVEYKSTEDFVKFMQDDTANNE